MFNLKDFLKTNLIGGVKNGVFAKEFVAISAIGYLEKGMLNESDVAEIAEAITPMEDAENTPLEDGSDDGIVESEESTEEA